MNKQNRIRMVDLGRQLHPLRERLENAAVDVIRSGHYLFGRKNESFEAGFKEWLGIGHAVTCASGTDALTLALSALGISEEDKVITIPTTAFATACAITRSGATPAFVDIDAETWLLDIDKAVDGIDPNTKAVVPVHLYGYASDIPRIDELIPAGTHIIEDCAQAHGAELQGKKVGTFGDASAFSFYPSKNLCALGDGGIVVTKHRHYEDKIRQLRFYGQTSRDHHIQIGMNSRMDEIQAAFLLLELEYIDQWVRRRREIAKQYSDNLDPDAFKRPAPQKDSDPSYHLYVIAVEDRDAFRSVLESDGIDTGIHYPVPIHLQPAYGALGYARGDFPIAETLADRIVSLPVGPHLDDSEVERVLNSCRKYASAGGD
jgi:dTDP-4-amino-4,6-dideoxygalactose transaminase